MASIDLHTSNPPAPSLSPAAAPQFESGEQFIPSSYLYPLHPPPISIRLRCALSLSAPACLDTLHIYLCNSFANHIPPKQTPQLLLPPPHQALSRRLLPLPALQLLMLRLPTTTRPLILLQTLLRLLRPASPKSPQLPRLSPRKARL